MLGKAGEPAHTRFQKISLGSWAAWDEVSCQPPPWVSPQCSSTLPLFPLHGPLLAWQVLGALTGLTALDLSSFDFGEDRALPHHLSNLSGLCWLRLGDATDSFGNPYDAEGWSGEAVAASLTCLRPLAAALTHLDLPMFGLDRVPAVVGELTALEELELYGNRLGFGSGGEGSGWVGAPLSHLTRLCRLDLSFCRVGCVPKELAALPRLQWLKLTVSRAASCRPWRGGGQAWLCSVTTPEALSQLLTDPSCTAAHRACLHSVLLHMYCCYTVAGAGTHTSLGFDGLHCLLRRNTVIQRRRLRRQSWSRWEA